ncbi:MAG: hypothetical protein E7501_00320 [Ruminococcus sp.]|nr:hypothetical protein [Ruminococcus sp.]MBQ8905891.1 hypothetical protein [Ruminococcus sp.]
MKAKKKLVSALAIVMIIACVLLIASTLTANILFSDPQATPSVFGNKMFLYTETSMTSSVHQNAVVHYEEKGSYSAGDIILYESNSGMLHISKIARIDSAPSEETGMITLDVINDHGLTEALKADAIHGLCVEQNLFLGKVLLFMTDKMGIIFLLVVPCVVLLVYVISRFIAAAQDDEDDDPLEAPSNIKKMQGSKRPQTPLFTPDSAAPKDKDFEEKKASLAENFSQKAADNKKKKNVPQYDLEDGRRALEQAAAARRRERVEKLKSVQISRDAEEETVAPREDLDDRVAEIKRAMEQRAAERRRKEEEEARLLAASKKQAEAAAEVAEEPVPEIEETPVQESSPLDKFMIPEEPVVTASADAEPETEAQEVAAAPAMERRPSAREAAVSDRRRAIQERAASQRQRQPRTNTPRRPAARPAAGPASFEDLMAKLEEEKNKLNGSR